MTLINALIEKLINYISLGGYPVIFLLMMIESTSLPIIMPAELILITIGYWVSVGRFDFWLAILVSVMGTIVGALINYMLAFLIGRKLLYKYGKYILLPVERVQKLERVFEKYSHVVTFTGRMMPLIKHVISLPAGLCRMPLHKFCFWTGSGSAIFAYVMVSIGMFIGRNKDKVDNIQFYVAIGFLLFTIVVFGIYALYDKYFLTLPQGKIDNQTDNLPRSIEES